MDHFLYRFCTFSEKLKKIYGLDWLSLNLLQNAPSKFVLLTLRLFVRWFQMPLERLSFVKTLPTSRIINATDSLIQNITRIVYLRWFTYDILSEEPWKPCCFIRANEVWLIFHFFFMKSLICPEEKFEENLSNRTFSRERPSRTRARWIYSGESPSP